MTSFTEIPCSRLIQKYTQGQELGDYQTPSDLQQQITNSQSIVNFSRSVLVYVSYISGETEVLFHTSNEQENVCWCSADKQ